MRRRQQLIVAALILIVALGLRIGEVQRTSYRPINDGLSYLTLAGEIAHSGDYSTHMGGAAGSRGPTAYFPPAYPYLLAAVDVIDGDRSAGHAAVEPARLSQALLGTVTVGLIGLIALELFGATVALIGLGIAAIYPPLIELSATIVAENLLTALVLAASWCALRARRVTNPNGWIALAGVLTGLAALTHMNGALLVIPLAFALRSYGARAPALLVGVAVLTVIPWTIRNAVQLHSFVPISDETGITLAGTYNPIAAAHEFRWGYPREIPTRNVSEPQQSSKLTSRALAYISDHPLAPVKAAVDNTRRLLELEGSSAWRASAASIEIPIATARIGVIGFWILCALALSGIATRRARRAPLWVWSIPVLLALSVILINAETPRFREPIDPFLILLAACALEALARRLQKRLGGAPVGGGARQPVATGDRQLVEMRERLA
jgi:4-amino-4-deoxy-L-arabinose transferase-like glycosyltransferase